MAEQWAIRVTWRDGGEAWATDTHDPRRVLVFDTEADADRRCVWLWQTRGALEVAALDVLPYVEGGRTDGDE